MRWTRASHAISALVFEGVRHYIGVMREKIGYQTSMRQAHSRVAFAALDNLIANHYIQSMKTGDTMTFDEAVTIMKQFSPSGNNLLDGLENVDEMMRDINKGLLEEDCLTAHEKFAFRLVVREMRKLFF